MDGTTEAGAGSVQPAVDRHKDAKANPPGAPARCNTPVVSNSIGRTCFQSDGDWVWVRDDDTNGWTTVAEVLVLTYMSYLTCSALPNKQGGWCNFDVGENACLQYHVYETHNGVKRNLSNWSGLYSAKTGEPCN